MEAAGSLTEVPAAEGAQGAAQREAPSLHSPPNGSTEQGPSMPGAAGPLLAAAGRPSRGEPGRADGGGAERGRATGDDSARAQVEETDLHQYQCKLTTKYYRGRRQVAFLDQLQKRD